MYIQRESYLDIIKSVTGKNVIKVLTGMRRVGKSTILKQIQELLLSDGISQEQIISINFELLEYESIRDYKILNEYINTHMVNGNKYFIFLDEIQEVSGFEKVVNSLHAQGNVELFITGSNSNLLSGELATYLTGRFYSIEILPLSFKEIYTHFPATTREEKFLTFIRSGGMPGILQFEEDTTTKNYLLDMYQSILLRDIVQRYSIRNIDLLKRFMQYIFANTSQLFSAASITKYLKSEGRQLSKETIYQYLDAAKDAFLIHGVPRFDIKGKAVLKTNEKFFVNDLGFRALYFDNELDIGQALENIVYLHLRKKGDEVFVGKLGEQEVDFIAIRGKEKIYIQVAYLLAETATIEREFSPLEAIDDNFTKMVLSMDPVNRSRNGIIHMNIIDYLLTD
ncbi:MAG: ATP-binding protein [Sphaerochaeta sp.]|jgi:predicted AAA+ superfamily ATPase